MYYVLTSAMHIHTCNAYRNFECFEQHLKIVKT